MKTKELRKTRPEELSKKLSDIRLELAKELGNVKMGRAVKNPGKVRELRRAIARILTVQRERGQKGQKQKQKRKNKSKTNQKI